jgi:hypothetical protein
MDEDPRKTGLKNGLRQLTISQLSRVLNYPGEMVLDTHNYHDGKFCPLAVAVGLDETMEMPTSDSVFLQLTEMGYTVYNTRGIKGNFYTTDRLNDLIVVTKEVLQEKVSAVQAGEAKCTCDCHVCSENYHIFCSKFMHGNANEAEAWFVEHPEVAQNVLPLSKVGQEILQNALQKIEKKG